MNARAILKTAMALGFAFGTLSLGIAGCGPSASSYCGKICDCVGCSDPERADCIDSAEDTQKAAADEGCADQYNALFACADAEFSCVDGQIDDDGCISESKAYFTCMQ